MAMWTGRLLAAGALALVLAGCQVAEFADVEKHLAPVPSGLERKMARLDIDEQAPIMLRIFKEESALEVWKQARDGDYKLLHTYEICRWSGDVGPKKKEGDRQAPEGFYMIHPAQMNPNSSYYLSFDLGFPNSYDRSHGRTGSYLMVHGDCSSRGCYAMKDQQIGEIYALAREAFRGGQQAFQVQAFPFRMTPENMARHVDSENLPFWEMLQEGYDHFEVTRRAPKVDVCGKRYVFDATPDSGRFSPSAACPSYSVPDEIRVAVASKQREDLEKRGRIATRLARREQREENADNLDATLASFFGGDSRPAASDRRDAPLSTARVAIEPAAPSRPAAAGEDARATPVVASATSAPVPRNAPRAAESGGGGGRFFGFFGRGDSRDASVTAYQASGAADGSQDALDATARQAQADPLPGVRTAASGVTAAPVTVETVATSDGGEEIVEKRGFFGRAWKRATGVFD